MIVYRVEHTTAVDDRTRHACGPMADVDRFVDRSKRNGWDIAYDAQIACARAMNGSLNRPTPWSDPKLGGIQVDEICGVDSRRNLRFWFGDSLPALERAGFAVRKYDVPDWACRVGESGQVVFKYRVATLVNAKEDVRD